MPRHKTPQTVCDRRNDLERWGLLTVVLVNGVKVGGRIMASVRNEGADGGECKEGCPFPHGDGSGKRAIPPPHIFI